MVQDVKTEGEEDKWIEMDKLEAKLTFEEWPMKEIQWPFIGSVYDDKEALTDEPSNDVVSEKGMFSARTVIWRENGKNVKVRFKWNVGLEANMNYSRVNNRFYPWYGYVNAGIENGEAIFDFQNHFNNYRTLGFPNTRYFEKSLDEYKEEMDDIYDVKSIAPGSSIPQETFEAMLEKDYPVTSEKTNTLGASYRTYLLGEHFELLMVNQNKSGSFYTVSPEPERINGIKSDASPSGSLKSVDLEYTVNTDIKQDILLPWPKSELQKGLIDRLNTKGQEAFELVNSKTNDVYNLLTGQARKVKISQLFLSPETDGDGVFNLYTDALINIPNTDNDADSRKPFTVPFLEMKGR